MNINHHHTKLYETHFYKQKFFRKIEKKIDGKRKLSRMARKQWKVSLDFCGILRIDLVLWDVPLQ